MVNSRGKKKVAGADNNGGVSHKQKNTYLDSPEKNAKHNLANNSSASSK